MYPAIWSKFVTGNATTLLWFGIVLNAACSGNSTTDAASNGHATGGNTSRTSATGSSAASGGSTSSTSSSGGAPASTSNSTPAGGLTAHSDSSASIGGQSARSSGSASIGGQSARSSGSASIGGQSARSDSSSSTGGQSARSSGSASIGGGATQSSSSAAPAGGQSCAPANPDGPPEHASSGFDTQPCSDCHKNALSGGLVYDLAGETAVAQATVTITPTAGVKLSAATGSNGMFVFRDTISAPYVACVSKCPDTRCSKATDHPTTADCGTCHGLTTAKIHLP